MPESVKTCETF